jgi:hypothetical protein
MHPFQFLLYQICFDISISGQEKCDTHPKGANIIHPKTGDKSESVLCPAPKPHGPFEPFMREGFGIFAER